MMLSIGLSFHTVSSETLVVELKLESTSQFWSVKISCGILAESVVSW